MSCYMVSNEHIRELAVFWALRCERLPTMDREQAKKAFHALALLNAQAVADRYGGELDVPVYEITEAHVCYRKVTDPVAILRMVAGLRYQCIDADEYDHFPGRGIMEQIERAAIRALPGYQDAPWEYMEDEIPEDHKTEVISLAALARESA